MASEKKSYGFRDSYYQDHSRKIVLGGNGNPKVEYVYEGLYHTLDGTDRQWKQSKLNCTVLTVAAAACLVWAMQMETYGNFLKDIAMLQAISLLLFFGTGVGVFNRMTAPRHMTQWEYRMSVATIREFSLLLIMSLGILLTDEALSLITGRIPFDLSAALLCLKLAFCFFLISLQYRMLKKESYLGTFSDDLPHGIDITNDFEAMP